MSDSYQEVTSENIFTRMKNALGGIIIGLLLFVISFPVLWINEGRAVKTAKALTEVGNNYTVVSADVVDPNNENKLVYLTGTAITKETLTDGTFSIATPAIKLVRHVEMYQWKESSRSESKEKLGGTKETVTTYTYSKVWSSHANDSTSFKKSAEHTNPSMQYSEYNVSAEDITVGAFTLSSQLRDKMASFKKLQITQDQLAQLPTVFQGKAKVLDGAIYLGEDPSSPQIGDYKISFSYVPSEQQVSILAKQHNKTFAAYTTSNGRNLQFIRAGDVSADQIVGDAQSSNSMLTWILRGVGVVMMFVGLSMIATPLSVLASVIPPLGNFVGAAFGVVFFFLSLALSFIVISVAWVFYRPVIGICLIVVAIGLLIGSRKISKKNKALSAEPETA